MKNQLKIEIGQRMRKIRKALGLTQEKIVEHFSIGRANYSRIEKGEVHPGALILSVMRSKFNVSLDWLISNNGTMFLRNKEQQEQDIILNFGASQAEIREMLQYMEKSSMVKHALLSYFFEYMQKNKDIIKSDMEERTPPTTTVIPPITPNLS